MSLNKQNSALLAVQHLLAMFGATVLVPFLTGTNPSLALLSAGAGTLLFHALTKGMVPAFLGSSFAFIGIMQDTLTRYSLAEAKAGAIAAGFMYVLLSLFAKIFGADRLRKLFPPVVVGPMIVAIGLRLAPAALQMAGLNDGYWQAKSALVALITVSVIVLCSVLNRSFFRMMPILAGIAAGCLAAAWLGFSLKPASQSPWLGLPPQALEALKTPPRFHLGVMLAYMLTALVVFMEHIGDISTNGAIVGKDFFKNPGLHRTLLGDGAATALAGCLGGPPNTTYGENTGVLAITKNYDPKTLRYAAILAIFLAFLGKFGSFLQAIPQPVMGGASIVLFGMIAASGIRVLLQSSLDFSRSRNLIICAIILSIGIGAGEARFSESLAVSGLTLAALAGVTLNALLPKDI